jgi:F-type H+-transporting ATPase subunit delta
MPIVPQRNYPALANRKKTKQFFTMKTDKKINQFAKKLVELSKDEGAISEQRVAEVLSAIEGSKHRQPLRLLKAYLIHIRRELALQTARVSTPTALGPEALAALESGFSARYNRPIRVVAEEEPSLIAGLRVRVGDDLYDASLVGRLQRLANSVR